MSERTIFKNIAKFFEVVCSDICIKNNVMKSDSILVNETRTLCNE